MFSMLPEDLYSEHILSSLQLLLCSVAAVKSVPVHHYSAENIFWSLGINGLILSQLEKKSSAEASA